MDAARKAIGEARALVDSVVEEKAASPLEAIDAGPLEKAETILNAVMADVAKYNGAIQALNEAIENYKKGLAQVDIAALRQQRRIIELRMIRNAPEVVQHLASRTEAENERKEAERKKDAARKTLDQHMATSLATFQTAINARLQDFGAPFSIRELKPNYMGGGCRAASMSSKCEGHQCLSGRRAAMP